MRWALIDASYLAYRSMYSVGDLSTDDLPTGVVFGFFHQLRTICRDPRVATTRMAVFFDSPDSYRAMEFSGYKEKRRAAERTPEERERLHVMWDQVRQLRDVVLPAIGIQVVRQRGLESDDLIAYAAQRLRECVMVTADGDLFQCISETASWYDPSRRRLLTPETFREQYGIEASRWGEVKCIAGCSTDNVPGVPGVGEKTAVRYLNGQLPPRYKTHQAIISAEGQSIRHRNASLVVLPHRRTLPFRLRRPNYSVEYFFKVCVAYGLDSFLAPKARADWTAFFQSRTPILRRPGERRR